MKKLTLLLLLSLFFVGAGFSQIVITEIMYNPPEDGTDSLEYLEFYNAGNTTVDMENWTIVGVTFTFPAMSLAPNEYVLTAINPAAIQNQFGKTALAWAGGALNNSGELIALLNAVGDTIDKVPYSDTAPWPTGADGQGYSLVLCDPNADNSLPGSWQDALTPTGVTINNKQVFANPGAASNCPTGVTAINDGVVVQSGETITINVLQNDNLPGANAPVVTITGNPANGNAMVNPDNTISYTSNNGYCGSDMLTYQVCENSDCDEAMVIITVQCYPQYTIDQINNVNANGVADSSGTNCELTATTYGVNLRPGGLQFTMIDDDNNGITVLNFTGNFGYAVTEGDKITVRGVINQFNGLLQIFPDTLWKVSAGNPLVTPLVVQVHGENTESKLIRINNLRYVDQAQWATGVGTGFSVYMVSDDHPLDTIQVRIDNDVNLFNQPAPPAPFDLIGIGGQFDTSDPYTDGYQIAPRYIPDVSTLVGIREADFSANVQIAPNPASEMLRLQTDISFDALRIFTATGQLKQVIRQPGLQLELPIRDFAEGVYFIRFEKDGAAWTTRFVKL